MNKDKFKDKLQDFWDMFLIILITSIETWIPAFFLMTLVFDGVLLIIMQSVAILSYIILFLVHFKNSW